MASNLHCKITCMICRDDVHIICGCVGIVLAVNGEVVEGRNMNNDCAPNLPQKQSFTSFCSILFVYFTFDMLNCLAVPFLSGI